MKEVVKKLAKLINVKSIITIGLTFGFLYLTVCGVIAAEQFVAIYSTVIAFYFSTQALKKDGDNNGDN